MYCVLVVCLYRLHLPPPHPALARRALRPLRAASRIQGIKIVVTALVKAMDVVLDVVLVGALFYFVFSVLAGGATGGPVDDRLVGRLASWLVSWLASCFTFWVLHFGLQSTS